MLTKCTVQEAKSPVKNLVRQRCAEGLNSGVKGLIVGELYKLRTHTIQVNVVFEMGRVSSIRSRLVSSSIFLLNFFKTIGPINTRATKP
jgi:hypothetical protein